MRRAVLMLLTLLPLAVLAAPPPLPSPARIDAEAQRLMRAAHARHGTGRGRWRQGRACGRLW